MFLLTRFWHAYPVHLSSTNNTKLNISTRKIDKTWNWLNRFQATNRETHNVHVSNDTSLLIAGKPAAVVFRSIRDTRTILLADIDSSKAFALDHQLPLASPPPFASFLPFFFSIDDSIYRVIRVTYRWDDERRDQSFFLNSSGYYIG